MASEDLLKKAFAAFKALSPEQQAEMLEEQRQSWVRGNVGLSRDERDMTSPMMRALKIVRETNDKGRQALQAWADSKTRPAPAATDTGLVRYAHDNGTLSGLSRNEHGPWCLHSQAEELLAAERAEKEKIEADNDELVADYDFMRKSRKKWKERAEKAEADNAAQAARIKELEAALDSDPSGSDLWRYWSRKACEASQKYVDEVDRAEALEAKLAAAEKVRKAAEHVVCFDWSDNDDDAVKAVSDLRAVLGGKPS